MHQPLTFADEEGMGGVHAEVEHRLAEHRGADGFDHAVCAIGLEDVVAGLEVFNGCPPPFKGVEGVVVGGFNDFAVNRQEGDGIGVFAGSASLEPAPTGENSEFSDF